MIYPLLTTAASARYVQILVRVKGVDIPYLTDLHEWNHLLTTEASSTKRAYRCYSFLTGQGGSPDLDYAAQNRVGSCV